jgi:protein phosphatase
MRLDAAARTHAGRVRPQNEDAYVCRPERGLFAVVDGMGGEEAGEVAAAIAVDVLAGVPGEPGLAGETILARALHAARERILGEADAEQRGMGAVATALRLDDDGRTVAVAHVGDTRAYLVNGAGLRRLTTDHVGDAGEGKPAVARDLGRRDMPEPWVETARARVEPGDLLLLCTDGLTDVVDAGTLAGELSAARRDGAAPADLASRLVGLALAGGGPDNVTVVVVRVGRFSRGKPAIWAPLVVVAAALLSIAGLVAFLARPPALPGLRPVVSDTLELSPPELAITAGTRTAVGGTLVVRGAEVVGSDWTVDVGGALRLERCVLALDGLDVHVEAGASAVIRDCRVEKGRVRLTGRGTVILDHVTVPSADAIVVEGGLATTTTALQVQP